LGVRVGREGDLAALEGHPGPAAVGRERVVELHGVVGPEFPVVGVDAIAPVLAADVVELQHFASGFTRLHRQVEAGRRQEHGEALGVREKRSEHQPSGEARGLRAAGNSVGGRGHGPFPVA